MDDDFEFDDKFTIGEWLFLVVLGSCWIFMLAMWLVLFTALIFV